MTTVDSVLIGLVRKVMPNLIANDIIGVQPMMGSSAEIFGMRSRYEQEIRIRMTKEHYKTFLRVNDRPKTQPLRAFTNAGYPHVDLPDVSDTIKAIGWCREQFGEHGYQRFHTTFIFKDEDDAMLFRISWLL